MSESKAAALRDVGLAALRQHVMRSVRAQWSWAWPACCCCVPNARAVMLKGADGAFGCMDVGLHVCLCSIVVLLHGELMLVQLRDVCWHRRFCSGTQCSFI